MIAGQWATKVPAIVDSFVKARLQK